MIVFIELKIKDIYNAYHVNAKQREKKWYSKQDFIRVGFNNSKFWYYIQTNQTQANLGVKSSHTKNS